MTTLHNSPLVQQAGAPPTAPVAFNNLELDYEHFPEYPEYAKGIVRTPWPPGFMGELAKYLYCCSAATTPEYAIATAIGFFAGICGRAWGYGATGLNHDIIILGDSGTGKNVVHLGVANIVKQLSGSPISLFVKPGKMASAHALIKELSVNPGFVQLIGEVGKMYRAYAHCKHGDHMDQLFTLKLDLWGRSGPDGTLPGIFYSDTERNVEGSAFASIAHSTVGDSTLETFYGAITTDMMNEGLLSRLWIFEYEGEDPTLRKHRLEVMPSQWVRYLSAMALAASGRLKQQPVNRTDAAAERFESFSEECNDEKRNAGKDPARRQLWVRAYEKVVRLAALLAVADNYITPVVTIQHAEWAIGTLLYANLAVQRRVCDGDISDDADHAREEMIRQRCRRWFAEPRKDAGEEAARVNGLVPRRFLQQEVATKDMFKKHRLGAVTVFNLTMKSLVDNGYLIELSKDKLAEKYGIVRGQYWLVMEL
jgi:hypothetical protein